MSLRIAVTLLVALAAASASAQPVTTATPVNHGQLDVHPARGTIDPVTGMATLKAHDWRFLPVYPSPDGVYPAQEPIVIALSENNFYLPAGAVKASRHGTLFRYRAPRHAGSRGIRSLRLMQRQKGIYLLSFTLTGVDLSQLTIADRACVPMAFIVGDDDGFNGASLRRPSFTSRTLLVPGGCPLDNSEWPWLQ
jgi:hypothetical protein